MVRERIAWLDFVKLLAIYLVVLGHVILFMGLDKEYVQHEDSLYVSIYAFHMPLFMTISGFFSYKIAIGQGNIKRKFMQLIVPCISLGIVCLIAGIDTLNFWYLKSLFLCYVIWSLFFRWFRRRAMLGGLLMCLGAFLLFPLITRIPYLSAYKVDFMLPFFGLGLLLSHYKDFVQRHLNKFLTCSILLFALGLYHWDSSYIWYFSKPQWIDYKALLLDQNLVVDMTTLWQTLWRYAVGCFATAFILFTCWSINNYLHLGGVTPHLPSMDNTPYRSTSYSLFW